MAHFVIRMEGERTDDVGLENSGGGCGEGISRDGKRVVKNLKIVYRELGFG